MLVACVTPAVSSLGQHQPDVLWAFLHLAGQVQRSRQHERRLRFPDLDFGVESAHIDLRCRQGLLPDGQRPGQLLELCTGLATLRMATAASSLRW